MLPTAPTNIVVRAAGNTGRLYKSICKGGLGTAPYKPLICRDSVDRISSVVHRGVSHDGRFVGGGARNQEPDGDTRHKDIDLDMFGSSDRRNTIRPVSLVYCIEM